METETEICHRCKGTGKSRFGACGRCGGTGKIAKGTGLYRSSSRNNSKRIKLKTSAFDGSLKIDLY